ncbi:MAG: hypothetical protein PHE38_16010 [Alishewanella agri]|nr:hypothetical protein [Alishewanella agri]
MKLAWLDDDAEPAKLASYNTEQLRGYLLSRLTKLELVTDPEAIGGPLYSNLYLMKWLVPFCTLERNMLVFAALAKQSPLLKRYIALLGTTSVSHSIQILSNMFDEPTEFITSLLSPGCWLERAGFMRFKWNYQCSLLKRLIINRSLLSRLCNEPYPFDQNLSISLFYLESVPTVVIKRSQALTMAAWLLKVQLNKFFGSAKYGTKLIVQSPINVPIQSLITFSLEKFNLQVVNLHWALAETDNKKMSKNVTKLCQILEMLNRKHQVLLVSGAACLFEQLEAPDNRELYEILHNTLRHTSYPLIWLIDNTILPPKLLKRTCVNCLTFNPLSCEPSAG